MDERRIRRNGRGQIISYEIERDDKGFPLASYGLLEFGTTVTRVDKYDAESYNTQIDLNIFELEFDDVPDIEPNPKTTIIKPTDFTLLNSGGGGGGSNAGGYGQGDGSYSP